MTLKTSSEKPGITPAWAGKSDIYETLGTDPEDHPRVGGEKIVDFFCMVVIVGSPPRGRGKGRTATTDGKRTGITPAWAGKSRRRMTSWGGVLDHPRVGGEKGSGVISKIAGLGSPPRGRGKVMLFTLLPMGRGITPAWAGKSMIVRSVCLSSVDHPRVGGEKIVDFFCMVVIVGSPPRGRGKGRTATTDGKRTGITPAWAGKRSLGCNLAGCTTDHPRVGGEKCCFRSHTLLAWGSPPRGRGKASTARRNPAKPGITPAWAGKSEVLSVAYRCCVDHPRVGGEKQTTPR